MKRIFSLFCVLLALLTFLPSTASADVWAEENQWDDLWEGRYRQWVRTNWKDDIFMDPSKPVYYKYENDCADAVYAMRLIFAFEHRLPFVINNRDKAGQVVSNRMKTWDNLSPPQRVRRFMDYVGDMHSSESLRTDSYPDA